MQDLASRSYWLELDPYTASPPLRGDEAVDVALVGGGFTSLWTAYLLLRREPGLRVAILEANAVGYGASGRNGGFAMTLVHRTLTHLAAYVGDEQARRIYLAAKKAVEHIEATIDGEAIACDPQPTGLLTLSNTPAQDRIIREEVETATRLGLEDDFEYLECGDARARLHSERIRCAFREDACLLVNPARLARGLKAAVERSGARVYEGTPVTSWTVEPRSLVLQTPVGSVAAERALIAGNAYATTWESTRETLLPFYTYICLTRPLTETEWERVGWEGREGAEDRRVGLHYFRPTIDGRILWGGRDPVFRPDGPKPAYDRDRFVFRRLRESFDWFFPQLRDVPFEHRWGGPIAITGNFLPAIGWLGETGQRIAYAYGYNGHGVAISNLAAHAVADLFAGRQSEWTDLWFVGRDPLGLGPRWIRNPMIRLTVRSQVRADDEGREARDPWVLRLLNKISGADLRTS